MTGESSPKTPRPASTVILVREHEGVLQVYLLKRNPKSKFFPGDYVFPGGALAPQDYDSTLWRSHSDLPWEELAARFAKGSGEEEIPAYGIAAIRETFEEAGVFLGTWPESDRAWFERACSLRTSEGLPGDWLNEWVFGRSWVLGFSSLLPWSHWITPHAMPRRFDTRFFLVRMPPLQTCSPDLREMVHGAWLTPEQTLARNLRGETPLSPPTLITMHEMLPYRRLEDLAAVLGTRSWGEPILPRFIRISEGAVILEPWDPMYGDGDLAFDPARLESALLPIGKPFSRIWLHRGAWRPVGI